MANKNTEVKKASPNMGVLVGNIITDLRLENLETLKNNVSTIAKAASALEGLEDPGELMKQINEIKFALGAVVEVHRSVEKTIAKKSKYFGRLYRFKYKGESMFGIPSKKELEAKNKKAKEKLVAKVKDKIHNLLGDIEEEIETIEKATASDAVVVSES